MGSGGCSRMRLIAVGARGVALARRRRRRADASRARVRQITFTRRCSPRARHRRLPAPPHPTAARRPSPSSAAGPSVESRHGSRTADRHHRPPGAGRRRGSPGPRARDTAWHETYDHLISKAALEKISPSASPSCGPTGPSRAPSSRCVAALVDGEIVGFAGSGPARDKDAPRIRELYFIYLLDAFHGTGIGQKPVRRGRSSAEEPLYLWVADDNPRAHRFYARNGFALDGATHTEPFLGETLTEVRFVR